MGREVSRVQNAKRMYRITRNCLQMSCAPPLLSEGGVVEYSSPLSLQSAKDSRSPGRLLFMLSDPFSGLPLVSLCSIFAVFSLSVQARKDTHDPQRDACGSRRRPTCEVYQVVELGTPAGQHKVLGIFSKLGLIIWRGATATLHGPCLF